MHQYAKGSSIHSLCQFEWYKNNVNNKLILVPVGLQHIQTLDDYIIPLNVQDGLTHLKIRPYTDQEFETLPHVILTSKLEWDPLVLDHEFKEDEQWGEIPTIPSQFYEVGDYTWRISLKHQFYFKPQDGDYNYEVINQCIIATHTTSSVYEYDGTIFFNAYDTEILDAPISPYHHRILSA
jgi:hypothetical protein